MTAIDDAYIAHLRAENAALTQAVRIRREDLARYEARLASVEQRLADVEQRRVSG